jgi:hypothetical protein
MNCQLCQKELIAYYEDKLSESMKTLVKAHIEGCTICTEQYHHLIIADKVISEEKGIEPNPFLATRIMAEIEMIGKEQVSITLGYQKIFKPALITVSLTAAILAGIFMGNIYNPVHKQNKIPAEMAFMNDAEIESVNLFSNE